MAFAYSGAPWFEPRRPYTQSFPDPSVIRIGSTYYAYATTTGGAYLPVMSSTDLRTWIARPAYNPGPPLNSDPYFNDALPYPARWGVDRPVPGRLKKVVNAPDAAKVGSTYVVYYAILTQVGNPDRYCISVAISSSPLGPFVDNSTEPVVCDPNPAGSLDPAPFVDDDGTPYLVWKSEGVVGSTPTRIWIRQLNAHGTNFAPGSQKVQLLETTLPWEGNVIENPAMVRHGGRLYLFYSANEWRSTDYAIGYAECASLVGPCIKFGPEPFIASHDNRLGPGGPAPFVDTAGRLQLAFHYWNAPYTDYPAYPDCERNNTCTTQGQRRLRVEAITLARTAPPPRGLYLPFIRKDAP
ncbi:MAG: family 43 glycosylhydrolase [Chloroflexi bacterium]|nr:family 43 glycosylhydrolase [Chloroflexota bacterium]